MKTNILEIIVILLYLVKIHTHCTYVLIQVFLLKLDAKMLDNRWVVPYNPYLNAKFNCHINAEICSSINAVKYLYKYVYKGHDRIHFLVIRKNQNKKIDEIFSYQSAR